MNPISDFKIKTDSEIDHQLGIFYHTQEELQSEALLTRYQDFYNIFKKVNAGSFCELGCGYGRGAVVSEFFPDIEYFGIEIDEKRISNIKKKFPKLVRTGNYSRLRKLYDHYFVYLPLNEGFRKFAYKLLDSGKQITMIVIESHGDMVPFFERELPSTQLIHTIDTTSARHDEKIRFYKLNANSEYKNIQQQFEELMNILGDSEISLKAYSDKFKRYLVYQLNQEKDVFVRLKDSYYPINKVTTELFDLYQLEVQNPRRVYTLEEMLSIKLSSQFSR
jgi:SAM-dependent methyltransferase